MHCTTIFLGEVLMLTYIYKDFLNPVPSEGGFFLSDDNFLRTRGGCLWIKKWMQTFILYPSCEWGPWSQLLYLGDHHEVNIFSPTQRLT